MQGSGFEFGVLNRSYRNWESGSSDASCDASEAQIGGKLWDFGLRFRVCKKGAGHQVAHFGFASSLPVFNIRDGLFRAPELRHMSTQADITNVPAGFVTRLAIDPNN